MAQVPRVAFNGCVGRCTGTHEGGGPDFSLSRVADLACLARLHPVQREKEEITPWFKNFQYTKNEYDTSGYKKLQHKLRQDEEFRYEFKLKVEDTNCLIQIRIPL